MSTRTDEIIDNFIEELENKVFDLEQQVKFNATDFQQTYDTLKNIGFSYYGANDIAIHTTDCEKEYSIHFKYLSDEEIKEFKEYLHQWVINKHKEVYNG